MATKPIPEAEVRRRLKALEDHKGNISHAAVASGISRGAMQHTIELNAAPSGFKIKGTSTLVNADGDIQLQWIKTREDTPSLEEVMAQVRAALDEYVPPPSIIQPPENVDADLATLYPLADFHIGMLAWRKETNSKNWDLKIATATIKAAITRLISGTPASAQCIVLGLGDLLHSDNYENQTSRSGARLDVDGRYPRLLQAATDLMLFIIDLALQRHSQVLVRVLPGNHDDLSAIAVTLALSMFYKSNDRVTVDDDAGRYWFWLWGRVLLGACHGEKAKMADLPLIMATRNPEAWGKAKFRHIHTGHIHQDKAIDKNGVTVEAHRAPIPPDSWHVGMGYGGGANQQVSAITYHKEQGEIIRQKVVIV